MALKAIRDTFAVEPIGPDCEVRRFVKAGTFLLPHFHPEVDADVEEAFPDRPLIIGQPVAVRSEGEATSSRKAAVRK
jgi:hypothetical protein